MCLFLLAASICALSGCGPGEVHIASYAPDQAADAALALCDANKDGLIDPQEATKAPSLVEGFTFLDVDKNRKLSREELLTPLEGFAKGTVGIMDANATVLRGGQPVSNATVTLVPEPFMGQSVKKAQGTSDAQGMVSFQVEGESVPGVQPGFYRVEVTGGSGPIAAKYNTQTILGWLVTPNRRGRLDIKIQ